MKANAFRALVACFLLVALFGAAPLRATCTVSCTATVPSTASVGASVSFLSTATPCDCLGGTSYFWTFGDGADSTAANPSHAYGSAGTYNWQLTVTSESATCVKSGSIHVGGITPPAGTYSGTTSLGRPFSVTVNGSSQVTGWMIGFSSLCGATGSTTVSGATCAITNGSFSCGSASCIPFSTQTSISGTFTSAYDVSGNATLRMMPGTTTCCTQTPTFTASRSPGPLIAGASSDVSSGNAPLLVNFTGSATGGTGPYSYHWDFGDCTTSSSQNPSHSYGAGNWTAVLTVTDSTSATDDAILAITALQGAGVTVTPTSGLTTSESGTDATFTVVLDTAPSANVTIEIHPSDTTEALLSTDGVTEQSSITLTFTTGNWSSPQTVHVHGQNDNVDDGNVGFTVITSPADSTDLSYDNLDPDDVSATNDDNDTAAVNVSPTTATVSESGTTDTFDVSLATEPAGNVVIDVASLDTGEATVSPAQLTFTSGDYATPQTVTVTGVDDALVDGAQLTSITVTMNPGATADAIYDAIDPADVAVTTQDDDAFEIVSTNPSANEAAAPRNGNIEATANATVNAGTVTQSTWRVQSDQTGRIAGTFSAAGATLQLDPTNDLKPGETIRLTATSGIESSTAVDLTPHVWQFTAATAAATGAFAPQPTQPSFTSPGQAIETSLGDLDGDGDLDAVLANIAGTGEAVWLNNGAGVLTHAGTYGSGDTYNVPLGDLDNDGDLDFVSANRTESETVWINDGNAGFTQHATTFDGVWTHDAALGDLDGDGDLDLVLSSNAEIHSTWLNDGTGGFTAHPTTPTFTGTTNNNAIALGDVDGDGDLDAVTGNLTYAEVWSNDGSGNFTSLSSFSSGASYDIALGDVDGDGDLDAVSANKDGAAETVFANSGIGTFSFLSDFGAGDSRGVSLGDLDGDGDLDAAIANIGTTEETIWMNNGSGTFTAHPSVPSINAGHTWSLGLGDLDGDGDLDAVAGNISGQKETVWLNERVVVSPSSGLTTTEAGGTTTFTVVLGAAPSSNVTVDVSSSDTTEGRISSDGVTQQTGFTLTFTTSNWSTPQTVTLHGQNDAVDDGNVAYTIVTTAAASSDPFYSGVNVHDVSATNTDDETANVVVSETAVTVTESGSTDTFTVVLTSEPTGDVVIDLASLDEGEATVSPAQLTFTNTDWATPQLVTVTGVDDAVDDGDQNSTISVTVNTAATLDATYDAIDPNDVTATTSDDDTAGVMVTESDGTTVVTEAGSTDTFTIVLTSQPVGNAIVVVESADTGEATVSAPYYTFSAGDWSTPQTVTITGVNDALDDGNQNVTISLTIHPGSLDPTYIAINPDDVIATTTDDDTAGVTVAESDGTTVVTEAGSTDAFTVVLTSEPAGDVVIDVASSDTGEATVSLSQLTFTNTDWATPQSVTVTGVDDPFDDGDQNSTIAVTMNAGATADAQYDAIDPNDVIATTSDDDTAGVAIVESDGTTVVTETGSTDTFTVALTSEPAGNVVIDIASLDTGEATISPAQLTFTTGDWATPQTVTVTGVSDAVDDGNQNSTIALTINTGATADAQYDAIDPNDAIATTTDDDTAGVNVSAATVTVAETGTTATFTLVLTSEPVGDVVIDAASLDPGESTAAPSQLTFTSGNWTVPQTVTITGVNDFVDDGDQNSTIALTTNAGATVDALYDTIDPADVTATTTDNDVAGVLVVPSLGTTSVTEAGSTDTFAVSLNSEPTGNVVIDVASVDTSEATAAPAQLTFTSANWMTAQIVTVTGVDDAIDDGNQSTTIALLTNTGDTVDELYDGINPPDVVATTVDDEKTATTTTLVSSPNPSISNQSVTFTATVSAGTGTVLFKEGAIVWATVPVTGGSASFSMTALAVGSHAITATYSGDTNFFSSISNTVNQVVNEAPYGPPPFVIATPASATSISVSWSAVSGATSYELYRTTSTAVAYTHVITTVATTFVDGSLSPNTTYLYKVLAMNGGGPTALSSLDAATTTVFTDATLTSTIRAKAVHITQLRTAVNAMRAAATLPAASFTDPTITAGTTTWKTVHVTELRNALDGARSALGLPAISWTDPTLTAGSTRIKGAHITELRNGVQ